MVYSRARLSSAFLHGLQLGMRNSPPQIDKTIVYNLTTIFAQALLHLTTMFAAPHHRSTGPHHDLCCTSPQIRPHHDLCCTSPQIHTATTISNLAYRNPTPATAKVGSNLEINARWGWGLKLRSARCKRRRVKLTSLTDFSSLIFEGAF